MSYRRNSVYVQSANSYKQGQSVPSHDNGIILNRGLCVLTDSSTIAGDRYLKGFDLKVEYFKNPQLTINPDRFTLQFAVVPEGTDFQSIEYDNRSFLSYPLTQDTLYVTTLQEAYYNGVKLDNINKALPRGYYLVCYIWEHYNHDESQITEFYVQNIRISGCLKITF